MCEGRPLGWKSELGLILDILLERALGGDRFDDFMDCLTVLTLLVRLGVASMSRVVGSSIKGDKGNVCFGGASATSSFAGTGGGGGVGDGTGCSWGLYTVF
jgi:hypothetical protein